MTLSIDAKNQVFDIILTDMLRAYSEKEIETFMSQSKEHIFSEEFEKGIQNILNSFDEK